MRPNRDLGVGSCMQLMCKRELVSVLPEQAVLIVCVLQISISLQPLISC